MTLYVGTKRKEFLVHKRLLCQATDYFDKAFNSTFKEGVESVMYLPDDNPGTIGIFIHWLYRNTIALGESMSYTYELYDLYIFAEKICHEELKNKTIEVITATARAHNLRDVLVTPEIIRKVWAGLGDVHGRPTGLQRFMVNLAAWICHERCDIADPSTAKRTIRESDLKMISDVGKDYFNFELCFHRRFQQYIQYPEEDVKRADPRALGTRPGTDQCFYHQHKKVEDCHLKKKEKSKTNFLMD